VKDNVSGVVEVLSANTTINVAVPDALIGSVFGKQVNSDFCSPYVIVYRISHHLLVHEITPSVGVTLLPIISHANLPRLTIARHFLFSQ
jgi:hypothetical protein